MKKQHLSIAILVVLLLFIPLALPYQFAFSYWAESTWFWIVSFLIGAAAAIYVFFVFLEICQQLLSESEEGKEDRV